MADATTNNKFVTLNLTGHEGMVRGFFMARDMSEPASHETFPGIRAVAVLPREFDSVSEAAEFLEQLLEPGGNAGAVRVGSSEWLLGAWLSQ